MDYESFKVYRAKLQKRARAFDEFLTNAQVRNSVYDRFNGSPVSKIYDLSDEFYLTSHEKLLEEIDDVLDDPITSYTERILRAIPMTEDIENKLRSVEANLGHDKQQSHDPPAYNLFCNFSDWLLEYANNLTTLNKWDD
jgi:ABC-type oligopeptide transport system ATPase subunit